MNDLNSLSKIAEKWGFGMAPPKPTTQSNRVQACETLLDVVTSLELAFVDDSHLEAASVVKGLFNRVVCEDQWDWFTVSRQLGHPSRHTSAIIAKEIFRLRTAIKEQNAITYQHSRSTLHRLPLRRCLSIFLGKTRFTDQPGAGWIYILSNREFPGLLKIGMTTRTVEDRVQEINRATGVAIPFGVRRC